MGIPRLCNLSETKDVPIQTQAEKTYGGTVRSWEWVVEYPIALSRDGYEYVSEV